MLVLPCNDSVFALFKKETVSHEACQLSHMSKVIGSALCDVIGVLVN